MIRSLLTGLALFALAGCVTTTTSSQTAEENIDEAAQLNLSLGVSYYQQGNMSAAREKLEKAIEQKPDLADAHRVLGLVYQSMGDMPEAEEQYRIAVNLLPKDPDTINDYAGFLCFEQRETDAALKMYDRAIDIPLNENRVMLYSNAARCSLASDPERSEDYLRSGLKMDPENTVLLVQMADLAYREEQYLQSRVFLERANKLVETPSATMLYLLSMNNLKLGNYDDAMKYRRQLVEEYPLSEEAVVIQKRDR